MVDNTGKIMGEAHRAVPHDFKEPKTSNKKESDKEKNKMGKKEDFLESLKVDAETLAKLDKVMREHKDNNTSKKEDDGGRERGDEGPGSLGREPGLKYGSGKSNSKVTTMKADMKSHSNANHPKGQLSKNSHNVNNSGKTTAAIVTAQSNSGKTASNGTSGHSTSTASTGNGHSGAGGSSGGGHGASGGGHGGSGGGHGASGGGHGASGGGHGASGGSHGGH